MSYFFNLFSSVVLFASGACCGWLLFKLTNRALKEKNLLQEKLDQQIAKFNEYKNQTNNHLSRTADLLSEIDYYNRVLHEHLASSAQVLLSDESTPAQETITANIAETDARKTATTDSNPLDKVKQQINSLIEVED